MNDMFGNDLKPGDSVHVKVGNESILANIVKVQNGGIAVTGMPKNPRDPVGVTMDAIVVQMGIGFNQQPPGANHMMIMKLAAPNAVESVIESSLKM